MYYVMGIPLDLYTPFLPCSTRSRLGAQCWSSTPTTGSSGHRAEYVGPSEPDLDSTRPRG